MTKEKNLVPYTFTDEDRRKGGKQAALKRLKTNVIRNIVNDYIDGIGEFKGMGLLDDMKQLSGKDRITFLMNYLPYEKPKLSAVEQVIEVSELQISKEERQKRIKEILLKTG
jgi:hypothetical protein